MNSEFNFFDASDYTSNLRCTIQKSGKIGFTNFTQIKLNMTESMSIKIGIDGTKENFNYLIFQILNEVEPTAFKINKAGSYFYINPKALLDILQINYKVRSIMYEMIPVNDREKIYKLIKKENKVENK